MTEPTKRCPDCAEVVQADARICRFCSYDFGTGISGDGSRRIRPAAPAPAPAQPPARAANQGNVVTGLSRSGRRRGIIIVAVVVVVVIAVVVAGNNSSSSSSNGSSSPATDTVSGSDGSDTSSASLSIVAARSSCEQHPVEARISVYVAVKNDGGSDKTAQIMAARRYSDGTTNDSIMDAAFGFVPATPPGSLPRTLRPAAVGYR